MPFLFIGIIILIAGIYFHIQARKSKDKDGIVGTQGLIIAGILLILLFLFYRQAALFIR